MGVRSRCPGKVAESQSARSKKKSENILLVQLDSDQSEFPAQLNSLSHSLSLVPQSTSALPASSTLRAAQLLPPLRKRLVSVSKSQNTCLLILCAFAVSRESDTSARAKHYQLKILVSGKK